MITQPSKSKVTSKLQNLKDKFKQHGFVYKVIEKANLERKDSAPLYHESIIPNTPLKGTWNPTRFED
jgi:hypothetical protein